MGFWVDAPAGRQQAATGGVERKPMQIGWTTAVYCGSTAADPQLQLRSQPLGSGQVVLGFMALTAGVAEMPTPLAPTRPSSSSMLTM